jgi:hypothetical protein
MDARDERDPALRQTSSQIAFDRCSPSRLNPTLAKVARSVSTMNVLIAGEQR